MIIGQVACDVKAGDVLELDGNGYINKATPPLVVGRITLEGVTKAQGLANDAIAIPVGSQADPTACLRYDGGKEPLHLIPIRPLFELARVYGYGSTKYDDDNWRKATTWRRCISSMLRHVYRFAAGEDIDPESGVHHMAHAAFWAFALIDWGRTPQGRACDDRLKDEQETLLAPSQAVGGR